MTSAPCIQLSPPHISNDEFESVRQDFLAGAISPAEQVGVFELEFADALARVDQGQGTMDQAPHSLGPAALHVAAVGSGTAALHLALRVLPVMPGQEVFCSTFTSSASANPILYEKGVPVFIDCERTSWNMDPARLEEALETRARAGRLPRAVIVAHVYGQSADIDAIAALCEKHGVPLIEDAAEALGAVYYSEDARVPRSAGTRGWLGAYSFSENKIISTSEGGMLVSGDGSAIATARRLRTPAPELPSSSPHSQIGFEYKMNPILAAIGRGQLKKLQQCIEARRANFEAYRQGLCELSGIEFMPEAPWGRATRWLTCITIDPVRFGADREAVCVALESAHIESRPVWKPLHLQPVFKGRECFGGDVSEDLFNRGLCLPSGSNLADAELERVITVVRGCQARCRRTF